MIQLPKLTDGEIYTRGQVGAYIGKQRRGEFTTDDFQVVLPWFREHHVRRFMEGSVGPNVVVMEYRVWPVTRFEATLPSVRQCYGGDREKIEAIKSLLLAGEPAFPVWVVADHAAADPVPIKEGNHRLLAFTELGLKHIPVFITRLDDPPARR